MAELDTSGKDSHKGKKKKRKKMSTRVDMTPMVDLGFLLVTFFILTSTFSKPQTMEINMPVKADKTEQEQSQAVKESKAMTVILGANNKVYWYVGISDPQLNVSNFSPKGIRSVLYYKNKTIKDFVVLIKSTNEANYDNLVSIFDEMNIVGIQRFALVDIDPKELELIKNL
jgi:biopolymer transport protein ExbD